MATIERSTHHPRRPKPPADAHVDQVILKVVQRCNLNCTYCYVYNRGDESWRYRPPRILEEVVRKLADRINEHCERYGIRTFTVEIHGGEPLLLGKRRMRALLDALASRCMATRLRFTLQTNGTLLDLEWLELFAEYGVSFGISLDGPPELADQRRVMRTGGGSTRKVLDSVERLRRSELFDELFGGCLCVIDPRCDGAAVVDWFVEQGFSTFDFLLPDGNAVNLPQDWTGVEPYTSFLLSAFERWYRMGVGAPRIRKFEFMMLGLTGVEVPLDALGGDLRRLCVVESDGSIGVSDVTRICGGEFSQDALNIFDHSIDEHVVRYRIAEIQRVCAQCEACPYLASCGGGYLPHRFDGDGFGNPSLYCDTLYSLSDRMLQVLMNEIPSDLWKGDPTPGQSKPIAEVVARDE